MRNNAKQSERLDTVPTCGIGTFSTATKRTVIHQSSDANPGCCFAEHKFEEFADIFAQARIANLPKPGSLQRRMRDRDRAHALRVFMSNKR